ncbi:hypothetical protein IW261DRAFT_1344170 [Armillaria novae-zelandiae]|uniref:Uncharacterized protein n=1 Tax=Armillaria novae-zelandiae TaxID=153914 RepID=A0AA39NUJ8_9AGAR|nr:hypothetical protein IW261DRAFT_1344170 [Armillaria novae-zelandiae]
MSGSYHFPFRTSLLTVRVGDPNLCTLYVSIFEQQAITFPYLDFNGVSTKYNKLPINLAWLSGIQFRSYIQHSQSSIILTTVQ